MKWHGQKIEEQTLLLQQNKLKLSLYLLILIQLTSCALTIKRPKLEMALAKSAFLAAKGSLADKYSTTKFRKAELSFLKARSLYRKKLFDKAKKFAKMTVYYSERAEYESLKVQTFENENNDEFN